MVTIPMFFGTRKLLYHQQQAKQTANPSNLSMARGCVVEADVEDALD